MYSVLFQIFQGISIFLRIIRYVILGYCLLSWILPPTNRFYELLRNLAWPFIAPFRGIAQKLMMRSSFRIDLSPWFALLALELVGWLLWQLFYALI